MNMLETLWQNKTFEIDLCHFYCRKYDGDVFWVFVKLIESGNFWLLMLLILVMCLIPTLLIVIYETARPLRLKAKLQTEVIKSKNQFVYVPIVNGTPNLSTLVSSNWLNRKLNQRIDNLKTNPIFSLIEKS